MQWTCQGETFMMHIKCNEKVRVGNLKNKKKKLTQGTLQVKGSHTTADFHIIHLSDLKNEMQIA